jgi:uncharacterized protein (DUF433 family)
MAIFTLNQYARESAGIEASGVGPELLSPLFGRNVGATVLSCCPLMAAGTKPVLPRSRPQRTLRTMDANFATRITVEPGKRSGKPCIRGLRITVSDVLEYLASGMTEAEILADFPELALEDIRACLAFAAERERRLLGSVA